MNDWVEFKRSFTADQEDGLWQFFIDHSTATTKGKFRIVFHVEDIDDFWRRVFARYSNQFYRYEEKDKQKEMRTKYGNAMRKKIEYIREKGTLKQRLYVWLYTKTKSYLQAMGDIHKY